MPVILITALQPLYTAALGRDGVPQAVTGLLVMFSMMGLTLIGGGILPERTWHTLDRLRTTPISPFQIVVGKAVPFGTILVAQQLVILGYGVLVLGLSVRRPDLMVLIGLAWAITLLCGGAALATVVRSHGELSAASDLGSLFLTILGGAMVPLTLMPAWMRAASPFSPGHWALAGMRAAIDGDVSATLRSAAVLAAVALVLGVFATWRIRRGRGRRGGLLL